MNDLMVIEVKKEKDTSYKEQIREEMLDQIMNFSDYEDYILSNVIEPQAYNVNDFEDEDLADIIGAMVASGNKVTVEDLVQSIVEYNMEVITSAMFRFEDNIGADNWLTIMGDQYPSVQRKLDEVNFDHRGITAEAFDSVAESVISEANELLYRGMHVTYFQKIVSFCALHDIELHIDEESEIQDVLFFAEILDTIDMTRKFLMPSIHKAVLCSPLECISGHRAFIMGDTLYVPRDLIVRGVSAL